MSKNHPPDPRAWHATIIALFALWLVGPGLVGLLTRDAKTSVSENRTLAQWPGNPPMSLLGLRGWTVDFNSYLRDQIGFRSPLTHLHAQALYALGVSANRRVVLGADSFLFSRTIKHPDDLVEQVSGQRNLSPACIAALVEQYRRQQDFANDHQAAYLVTIVPNKAWVYRDKLPAWWKHRVSKETTILSLEQAATAAQVSFLSLREALTSAARERQVWRRDDTHWNANGAFVGYKAIARKLPSTTPRQHLELADTDVEYRERREKVGDLARLLGLQKTRETLLTATVRKKFNVVDRDEKKVKGQIRQSHFKTDIEGAPKVLIHSDSFVWAIFEFLLASSSEVLWNRGGSFDLPLPLIAEFRPDIVLVLQVEKGLLDCPLK